MYKINQVHQISQMLYVHQMDQMHQAGCLLNGLAMSLRRGFRSGSSQNGGEKNG